MEGLPNFVLADRRKRGGKNVQDETGDSILARLYAAELQQCFQGRDKGPNR